MEWKHQRQKVIAILYKVDSIGFLSCAGNFLKDARTSGTAVRAIIDDNVETIRDIFSISINTEEEKKEFFAEPCPGLRCTPMEFAALCGSINCFKYMIMNGAEINEKLSSPTLAGGNMEIVHLLEQKDIKFKIGYGCIPFITMQLVSWADTHFDQDVHNIVRKALERNRFDIVLYFIDQLSEKEKLFAASALGCLEIVKYLIEECKCKPNIQSASKSTPLHHASVCGHLDIVKYLIEKCHCDPDIRSNSGGTALEWCYSIEVAEYLIEECGARIPSKKHFGSPEFERYLKNQANSEDLFFASSKGKTPYMRRLVEEFDYSPQLMKDGHGKTALHHASEHGHIEAVKYLIEECHCDPDTQDNSGWTALSYAAEEKHEDIVQYLVEKCKATITDGIIRYAKPLKMKTYLREQLKKQNSNQNQ